MTPKPRSRRLDGELLDVAGAAALLGCSQKMLRARVARQLVPFRKWSGRVLFVKSELLMFLSQLDGCSVEQALANVQQRAGAERVRHA